MAEDDSFRDLMRRVRAGEEEAARELVRQYETEIRRAVRVRLTDPRLGRVVDSMDICQSVLANFFGRAAAGQFTLDSPAQLLRLLVTMAQNRLRDEARKQSAQRRDQRRVASTDQFQLANTIDTAPTPSQILSGKELTEAIQNGLSPEERYLVEQRGQGRDWADLAAELGGSPEALRKRHSRAIDRVSEQLGLTQVNLGSSTKGSGPQKLDGK